MLELGDDQAKIFKTRVPAVGRCKDAHRLTAEQHLRCIETHPGAAFCEHCTLLSTLGRALRD